MIEGLTIIALAAFAIGFFNLLEGWSDLDILEQKDDVDD